MNPELFSNLLTQFLAGQINQKQLEKQIINSKKEKEVKLDLYTIKQDTKNIFNTAWEYISPNQVESIWKIAEFGKSIKSTLEWAKNEIKNIKKTYKQYLIHHSNTVMELKETLKTAGIWKFLKKLVGSVLKLFGFKNWWEDFEKEVEKEKFKNTLNWFKTNLSINKLFDKDNKNLIFAKAFKNKKIQAIQASWKFSYKTLRFLSMPDSSNPDIINNKLQKIFSSKNFEEKLQQSSVKADDFYKKAFKVETKKNNKKEIKIWVINFEYIDKVLQKKYKQEIQQTSPINNKADYISNEYTHTPSIKINKSAEKIVNDLNKKINSDTEKLLGIKFNYKKYIDAVAKIESSGKYHIQNKTSWALGKYQFMPYTLQDYVKEICNNSNCTTKEINQIFLNNPSLQEKIMWLYTLQHLIRIHNKKISVKNWKDLARLLAICHFSGCGNLNKDWNIKQNTNDGNTTTKDYAKYIAENYTNNTEETA